MQTGNVSDDPNSETQSNSSHNTGRTNLIVNYLPQGMKEDEVRVLFSSVGEVESCKLIRDKESGDSLGYAFVNFTHPEDADKACHMLDKLKLQNKTIKVSFARPSSETIKGANLYVSGLPKHMTQEDMENLFSGYGNIITSRLLTEHIQIDSVEGIPGSDGPKISRGVGFIRFDQRSEAESAIAALNGTVPAGGTESLTVKFANNPGVGKNITLANILAPQLAVAAGRFGVNVHPSPYPRVNRPAIQNPLVGKSLQEILSKNYLARIPAGLAAELVDPVLAGTIAPTYPQISGYVIFVYNLPSDTEDNLLWQLFGPFGAVLHVKVIVDHRTKQCRGFGFVTMAVYEEAVLAINTLNGVLLGNRVLQVSFKSNNRPRHP